MSNASQFCLKGFNLKMMVVEPKMAQSVESNEELVDLFSSTDRRVQTPSLSSRMVVQPVKIEPQRSRLSLNQSRSSQGVVKVQWSPAKHYMLTTSQLVNP